MQGRTAFRQARLIGFLAILSQLAIFKLTDRHQVLLVGVWALEATTLVLVKMVKPITQPESSGYFFSDDNTHFLLRCDGQNHWYG